jgi:hypothetical protein
MLEPQLTLQTLPCNQAQGRAQPKAKRQPWAPSEQYGGEQQARFVLIIFNGLGREILKCGTRIGNVPVHIDVVAPLTSQRSLSLMRRGYDSEYPTSNGA